MTRISAASNLIANVSRHGRAGQCYYSGGYRPGQRPICSRCYEYLTQDSTSIYHLEPSLAYRYM